MSGWIKHKIRGEITLKDEEQDYIVFQIYDGLILDVQPSGKAGWVGTKVLNESTQFGGTLWIELHNGYQFHLRPRIKGIKPL